MFSVKISKSNSFSKMVLEIVILLLNSAYERLNGTSHLGFLS